MPFVSSGFPALDKILSGGSEVSGFPCGGLTLLGGHPGSGKSQIMKKCCERARKRGLTVVYFSSEDTFDSEYPVLFESSLRQVTRNMAELLHPGRREKVHLLVLDSVTHLVPDQIEPEPLGNYARQLGNLFCMDFGQTAVVGTFQARRSRNFSSNILPPSAESEHQASVILNVSNNNSIYHLELVKSKISAAGVSCEIRPVDMEGIEYFDRSKLLTRYQRILRGRD